MDILKTQYKERIKKLFIFFSVFFVMYGIYTVFDFPTFFFFRWERFTDFSTINNSLKDLNPYLSGMSNYPPFALLFALIFARMNDWHAYDAIDIHSAFDDMSVIHTLMLLMGLYAAFMFVTGVIYAVIDNKQNPDRSKKSKIINILISLFIIQMFIISAPSRYMMDRGNYLVLTIVFIMLWAIYEQLCPEKTTGSVFAALCAATKVYPLYLLGIYFTEKKWKKLITAIIVGIVVTVFPIFIFQGGFVENFIAFVEGIIGFGSHGAGGGFAAYYAVGITGFAGSIAKVLGFMPNGRITKLVWIVCIVFLTIAGFSLSVKEEKKWLKFLIITSIMVFITPNSFLYNTCYLFAPIFLMLMNDEKLQKIDIPYYVMTALLLVPKSYYYFEDPTLKIDSFFNHINVAVLIDCSIYCLIILYYFVCKIVEFYKINKAIDDDKKNKLVLHKAEKKIYAIALSASVLIMISLFLYMFRDTVLACHDSLMEFVYARTGTVKDGISDAFNYGLARGRVGFIFPLVVGFRFLVNGSGNYVAIWLLQYVPVCAVAALIGVIVAKKIHYSYGLFTALFFFGFLQVDVWHSLITSYPLDFMYGLFIMTLGLYLFEEYLEHLGEDSKKNIVRLVISLILYYESMQVYEAFIVSSLIYALLVLNFVLKNEKDLKPRLILFVRRILPHFIVAVIYIGVLIYLRKHPVVDIAVSDMATEFSFNRTATSYFVFSFGMFPLVDMRILPDLSDIFAINGMSKISIILLLLSIIGSFATLRLAGNYYSNQDKNGRKKTNRTLVIFLLSGVLLALSFAIPHSMIPVYQNWVIDGHVGGYVPTTICYFGWSLALSSIVLLASHFISRLNKKLNLTITIILSVFIGFAVFVTSVINITFKGIVASTGTWTSVKAQAFYALFDNDDFKTREYDLIYTPSYSGIHGDMEQNEDLADCLLGYDVELTNDYATFMSESEQYSNTVSFIYYPNSRMEVVCTPDEYVEDTDSWTTSEPIGFITPYGGTYEITYYTEGDSPEDMKIEDITLGRNEYVEVDLGDNVYVNNLGIGRLS